MNCPLTIKIKTGLDLSWSVSLAGLGPADSKTIICGFSWYPTLFIQYAQDVCVILHNYASPSFIRSNIAKNSRGH